jgi:restriction endonuclease S subunit
MTEMLDVQPGESVYDPTCGSGGMLLSCIAHLRNQKKEWRNVKLYGQERNLMTSSIARMNCFLHGIEDFRIERGDTLAEPKLVEGDRLQRFDVVLANPPYSIKQWNREAFAADPWGRNVFGVPPQGRADYAFQQHILQSLKPKTGRCAVLWPHGVLFRQEEAEMRRKLIEADLIECVLGLGPNLFYNSPMEACVVVCRTQKPKSRRGKILFINAVNEVTRERAQSFLTDEHLQRVVRAYQDFKDEPGFTRVATLADIRSKDGNLSIPLYVETETNAKRDEGVDSATTALPVALAGWISSSRGVRSSLTALDDSASRTAITISNGLTANPAWASLPLFDRAGWKRVRFGDVVENCSETCDPEEAGLERFVAMEHLEPGSLHVRSWGNVADGTTFTRRCRPGQVLFGKRRAYQRKVAVAEFEAVVSGDIYVLAPKDTQRLLPELLPFLCLSERFFQHAVGTSAGSLSPRTNWSSLASFEFDLPPLDQQRRIAEILWAVEEMMCAQETLEKDTKSARKTFFDTTITEGRNSAVRNDNKSWPHWREVTLAEAVDFLDGQRKPIKEADRAKRRGDYPYYGASGIIDKIDDFIFDEPLVLLGEDGANIVDRSSPLAFRVSGKIWVNNHAHVLRVKPPNSLVYVEYYLESLDYKPFVTGTAQPKLNKGVCEGIRIPLPDEKFQTEIQLRLLAFEKALEAQTDNARQTRELLSSLLNQFTRIPS